MSWRHQDNRLWTAKTCITHTLHYSEPSTPRTRPAMRTKGSGGGGSSTSLACCCHGARVVRIGASAAGDWKFLTFGPPEIQHSRLLRSAALLYAKKKSVPPCNLVTRSFPLSAYWSQRPQSPFFGGPLAYHRRRRPDAPSAVHVSCPRHGHVAWCGRTQISETVY